MIDAKPDLERFGRSAGRSVSSRWARRLATAVLDLVVFKPIAVFVAWLSFRANRIDFEGREQLFDRVQCALRRGRPVLLASNHVSWFDDPVIPMALFRAGRRASFELGGLAVWFALCATAPALDAVVRASAAVAGALALAFVGVNKAWWTLGALENLSDASVLRGKLALTRARAPGPLLRVILAVADPAIRLFMRSDTVKTVLVDRRPGEDARRSRERALEQAVAIAAEPAIVWVFFEGGRSKTPGVIAPARRGIGALALRLRDRGHDPLVVAISHRGMEHVIPPGAPRFFSSGHRVTVRWAELDREIRDAAPGGEQAVADAVRKAVVTLQGREAAASPDA